MAESFGVGVVGTGYVGLVTGACLSHLGHQVVCIDRDEERISALKATRMPFYEPGLEELVSRSLEQQRLSFADPGSLVRLVEEVEVIFIAVDTPQGEDGSADLSNVADVAWSIGWALAQSEAPRRERPLVVVNKSTVPTGSGDYVSMLVREGLEEAGLHRARPLLRSRGQARWLLRARHLGVGHSGGEPDPGGGGGQGDELPRKRTGPRGQRDSREQRRTAPGHDAADGRGWSTTRRCVDPTDSFRRNPLP